MRTTPPRPLFTDAAPDPDAQLDGIEFGNPVMMERQKWARSTRPRTDRFYLLMLLGSVSTPPIRTTTTGSHGRDQGNAALIAQDDALRAAVA